jgi:hypothetical protein
MSQGTTVRISFPIFPPYRYLATDKSFTSPFMELVKLLFRSRRMAYLPAAVPSVHPTPITPGNRQSL